MKMKKLFAMCLAGCMTVGMMTGCGGTQEAAKPEGNSGGTSTSEETTKEDAPAASGDAIFNGEATVYWAYPDSETPRTLQFDGPAITKYLNKYAPNITFKTMDAQSSADTQLQQIESAISSGCDFMIYQPALEESASGAMELMNSEGIPFISMVRTPFGGDCPAFVTMPFEAIAQQYINYMEKSILPNDIGRPYKVALLWMVSGSNFYNVLTKTYHETLDKWEDEGKIEIVFEGDSASYSASDMKTLTEQMLTNVQNDVDICITMNDEVGTAVYAALDEQGIREDVIVLGGCDSTAEGIARILEGWQVADVLPDYDSMGEAIARMAATYLATGDYDKSLINGSTDNNYMDGGIPTVLVDPVFVTKDNVQAEIFDKGVLTEDDVNVVRETLK